MANGHEQSRTDLLPTEIREALARGFMVVTANQRAARTLHQTFDHEQRQAGLRTWQPPRIYSWENWTAGLWRQLVLQGHTTSMLLNRSQELSVWRSILVSDEEWSSLQSPGSLASLAMEAWARLCAYQGEDRLARAAYSTDTRAFARWSRAFERRCQTEEWLSAAQLEGFLEQAVLNGHLAMDVAGLLTVGFDTIPPARRFLLEALRSKGLSIEAAEGTQPAEKRFLYAAEDERSELEAAATWSRRYLEQNPTHRIALLVPDLEKQSAAIERVLRRVFAPETAFLETSDRRPPFEFSLGQPLAHTALAQAALNLLRWATEPLSIETISQLLLSPYFAARERRVELTARAEFDAFQLRRYRGLRPELSLRAAAQMVWKAPQAARLSSLHSTLDGLQRLAASINFTTPRHYAAWAHEMRGILATAAWTGHDNSLEFQNRRRWDDALDELSSLDFSGSRVTYRESLDMLHEIAMRLLFAPESQNAPVQVLGPLEAAGSSFDAIWFLRAGELQWPQPVSSHPLLPWRLQSELEMPGSHAGIDAEHARRVLLRVMRSAPHVIFSYACQTEESHQRESSLLQKLALQPIPGEERQEQQRDQAPIELEAIQDDLSFSPTPDRVMRGGAEVLQAQAACGFRAFATHRLHATAPDAVDLGMDARIRGSLVHFVLECFWSEVKDQETLASMNSEERAGALRWAIDTALARTSKTVDSSWENAYLEVQRRRLLDLLTPWLELELKRRPFVVLQQEKEFKDVAIGPLRLDIRVDRIDQSEGGHVILDYKTGEAKPKDWLTDRPDQPQLPLYAILPQAAPLEGIAFAQIRAGKDMGLEGYSIHDGVLSKKDKHSPADLAEQVEEWKQVLLHLADDFHRGDARVNPKQYPQTCQFCRHRILCRLDASSLLMEEEETELDRD